jgi:hypothetical protein
VLTSSLPLPLVVEDSEVRVVGASWDLGKKLESECEHVWAHDHMVRALLRKIYKTLLFRYSLFLAPTFT